ncbi:MAG: alpha/beta fold hydrolase [Alphaproteobacteria bacterium]
MDLELDGRRVHVGTGGTDFDPGRPTAVFVHGAGLDHSIWALAARLFAQEGRGVLAVDLPGHGGSEGPPLESVDDMADWLLRLLDAVGAAKAALVGFSLGAAVALAATARAPERVRALALLGAAPEMPVHPRLLAFAEADDHRAIELMAAWCHGRTGHLGGQPAPGLWVMGAAVRLLERAAPGVLAADLRACHGFRDGRALAARVTCPALLIVGDRDLMTPAKGARVLADALPRAEMATFADCGHMVMSERPNPTLDALRRIV